MGVRFGQGGNGMDGGFCGFIQGWIYVNEGLNAFDLLAG